ncbi:unnamed protein product [Brachionus calyciflorus]|uniref:Integrase catalytic domain-containing protein n=1 Tax=Brachionus calyciflorus TaxID=104777 RepID=A0A814MDN2_9BILA|nr:unnamed protein product [Brachionus calyciflorus]
MILSLISKKPSSINCEFELAAINALKIVFGCKIYGCYFHLSQSFWRRIQTEGLKKWFNSDVRITFRKIKALAFIPESDVYYAFEIIKSEAPSCTKSFLIYIENNYIGKLKEGEIKNTKANKAADVIINDWCCRYGISYGILSDQATQSQFKLLDLVYDHLDIKRLKTTPFHPQCDGQSERTVQTLKNMIKCYVDENQESWYLAFKNMLFI